jgi:hypothetical protein
VSPKFSEHDTEVLTEFGYSSAEIDALIANGVVCGTERKRSRLDITASRPHARGTHNHRRLLPHRMAAPVRPDTNAGGYGSLLALRLAGTTE